MQNCQIIKSSTPLLLDIEDAYYRAGMILLATDPTTEHDLNLMCGTPRLRLHATRTRYANPLTTKSLGAIKSGLGDALRLLVPEVPLQAIYFSCTSGTALLGHGEVSRLVQQYRPQTPVITPLDAARQALETLGVTKLSILVPYTREVSEPVVKYFCEQNFAIGRVSYLDLDNDWTMACLSEKMLLAAAQDCVTADSDGFFISCTTVPSAAIAGNLEKKLGLPVVTSNQAAAWQINNLLDIDFPGEQYGSLMTEHYRI